MIHRLSTPFLFKETRPGPALISNVAVIQQPHERITKLNKFKQLAYIIEVLTL